MTVSPSVHILTNEEMEQIKKAAFARGVARGRFELSCEAPFETALELVKNACSLFWGRNGDMTHMNSDEFQKAHFAWYERANTFVRELQDKSAGAAQAL
jgi:hypothetical protein